MNKYLLTITVSALSLAYSNFVAAAPLNNSHTYTHQTHSELKPINSSFNLAAAVFLPDFEKRLSMSDHNFNTDGHQGSEIDNCHNFPLAVCPANGKCSKCSAGNKYKLSSCNNGYKISGNSCIAKTCSEINPAYRSDIPVNQVCNKISAYGKTCYQSCKNIDFSGYPLTDCAANAVCATHPDCGETTTLKGNCSPIKKKVSSCTLNYQKINSTASACIDKDDTCTADYFKSCDTGTQGDPQYTEKGTACYRCKPKIPPLQIGDILYSDMTTASELISGKTPIGVVVDKERHKAVALKEFPGSTYLWTTKPNYNLPQLPDYQAASSDASEYKTATHTIRPKFMTGKSNTATVSFVVGSAYSHMYPVFYQTLQYYTAGTKNGDWYLPSPPELVTMFRNITPINAALKLAGGDLLQTGYNNYWTSAEAPYSMRETDGYSWSGGEVQIGIASNSTEYNAYPFRVFIDYDDSDYKYSCSGGNFSKGAGNPRYGKYSACLCQTGYAWNPVNGSCEVYCSSEYKYTCTGTGYSGGNNACGGKYKSCSCSSGYAWNGSRCEEQRTQCTYYPVSDSPYCSSWDCSSYATSGASHPASSPAECQSDCDEASRQGYVCEFSCHPCCREAVSPAYESSLPMC